MDQAISVTGFRAPRPFDRWLTPADGERVVRCPRCKTLTPGAWLPSRGYAEVTWSLCVLCDGITIWRNGQLDHPHGGEVIAREQRISLVMDRKEQRFDIATTSGKYQLYAFLERWMRSLAPADLSFAIRDLCTRYSVDLAALSRRASMDWGDLAQLAGDPNVTIGSATVNHPVLSNLKDADAWREMTMGRAVAQAALRRDVRHFAFPFGDRASFRRQHVAMAEEAGFASSVSAIPGLVQTEGRSNLHALPRIAWDGRQHSLRAMRVILSGATLPAVKRAGSTGI